ALCAAPALQELHRCGRQTVKAGIIMVETQHVKIGTITVGNDLPFALIAGPCQMESMDHAMEMAGRLVEITQKLGIGLVYKTSFDKASRTALSAAGGLGLEGAIPVFERIRGEFGIPVLTDVLLPEHCAALGDAVDVLQIPACLCRQTDLLLAAAATVKVVNVKKGQFLAPWDMKNVANKLIASGNSNVLLTERGASF